MKNNCTHFALLFFKVGYSDADPVDEATQHQPVSSLTSTVAYSPFTKKISQLQQRLIAWPA